MHNYSGSFRIFLALIFLVLIIAFSNQEIVAKETIKIDTHTKGEIINKVADIMQDYYVFAEVGEQMGQYLKTEHRKGNYDTYTDLKEFCKKLTTDLREISHDKHIFVFYSPEEAREVAARNNLLPEKEIKKINEMHSEMVRRTNFGFSKVEILGGNIGYLKLTSFSSPDYAFKTAVAAIRFLSSSDAIIIDLRNNGGGDDGMVALLASYFFGSEKVELNGTYFRETGTIKQKWTLPYIPGKRMPDTELYILTSSSTFSAAEDFCYSLKNLKRAIIIGETTKGGAHPVDVKIINGNVLTQISVGYSVNPITKSNWEEIGVKPDIEVPAEKALDTAHLIALKKLIEKTTDDEYRQQLGALIENKK